MDIFKDEIDPILATINAKLNKGQELEDDDLKMLLLNLLMEEDAHENGKE